MRRSLRGPAFAARRREPLRQRFFATITTKAICRGTFPSVAVLVSAIRTYLDAHNAKPEPFVWAASADRILERTAKLCKTLA
jgi:putative transposase